MHDGWNCSSLHTAVLLALYWCNVLAACLASAPCSCDACPLVLRMDVKAPHHKTSCRKCLSNQLRQHEEDARLARAIDHCLGVLRTWRGWSHGVSRCGHRVQNTICCRRSPDSDTSVVQQAWGDSRQDLDPLKPGSGPHRAVRSDGDAQEGLTLTHQNCVGIQDDATRIEERGLLVNGTGTFGWNE